MAGFFFHVLLILTVELLSLYRPFPLPKNIEFAGRQHNPHHPHCRRGPSRTF
jgi:hypothetical protein